MARPKFVLDPMMTFDQAKLVADALWNESIAASRRLDDFVDAQGPRGPMNLTPDHVKAMPEYKALKAASDQAFQALRTFNGPYVKKFKKELAAYREASREAKLKANQAAATAAAATDK